MGRYLLGDAEPRDSPLPYFTTNSVFEPADADELLTWLEETAPWELRQASFYEQHQCNLLVNPPSGKCARLFGDVALNELRASLETWLGVKLQGRFFVAAHKLMPGQGIGLHNDDPEAGSDRETHRLLVQLNRGWNDDFGGHLLFFHSESPFDIAQVIRPVHDGGVGFPLSRRSYHAVSRIRGGARFTVVYSFWEDRSDESGRSNGLGAPRAAASREAGHTSAAGCDHLVKTCSILERWKCPSHLRKAGLFHTAYGGDNSAACLFPVHDRQILRGVIGNDAEDLVYWYSVASDDSLRASVVHGPPFAIVDRRDGTVLPVAPSQFADLLTLRMAAFLQRLHHQVAGSGEANDVQSVVNNRSDMLPADALIEMRWVFEPRNHLEGSLAS